MLTRISFIFVAVFSFTVWAEEASEFETERDPAASVSPSKRSYPGGADEEDLRVQAQLPEAAIKVDARTVQKNVFRDMFNQELKDERQDSMEE